MLLVPLCKRCKAIDPETFSRSTPAPFPFVLSFFPASPQLLSIAPAAVDPAVSEGSAASQSSLALENAKAVGAIIIPAYRSHGRIAKKAVPGGAPKRLSGAVNMSSVDNGDAHVWWEKSNYLGCPAEIRPRLNIATGGNAKTRIQFE